MVRTATLPLCAHRGSWWAQPTLHRAQPTLRLCGVAIEVGSCGGELGSAAGGVLAGDDLIDADVAVEEGERDAGQVGGPQAITLRTDELDRFVAAGRQPLAPQPRRLSIVLSPVFDVVDLEAADL